MALTRKQALLNCKKMWQYIAYHGCNKMTATIALWPNKSILVDCWACEFTRYVKDYNQINIACEKCPLWDYDGKKYNCIKIGSPYYYYKEEIKKLCPEIAIIKEAAKDIVAMCDDKLAAYTVKK